MLSFREKFNDRLLRDDVFFADFDIVDALFLQQLIGGISTDSQHLLQFRDRYNVPVFCKHCDDHLLIAGIHGYYLLTTVLKNFCDHSSTGGVPQAG